MNGFFVSGDSWLHRLDPVTKLVMTGVALGLLFVVPTILGSAGVVAVVLTLLVSAGLMRPALKAFVGVWLVALSFLVVQGIVYPGNAVPALQVGPLVFYREGLAVGLLLVLRIVGILAATLLVLLATRPVDLVESLERRGLPRRIGYVLSSVVLILPTVVERFTVVRDAQRARGLETDGGIGVRLRSAVPLLAPVVASSLVATEERALALEVRGFSTDVPRTFVNEERPPAHAPLVRASSVALLVIAVAARLLA